MVEEWRKEMREQTKPQEGNEESDHEVAWKISCKKIRSWKAPGPDGIQGFWLKQFPRMLTHLRALFRAVLEGTLEVP